jgi:hypothetical protein
MFELKLIISIVKRVQKYVKEQVLQVVAVIFKRGTLDGNNEAWMSLFGDLTQLITGSDTSMVGIYVQCLV